MNKNIAGCQVTQLKICINTVFQYVLLKIRQISEIASIGSLSFFFLYMNFGPATLNDGVIRGASSWGGIKKESP